MDTAILKKFETALISGEIVTLSMLTELWKTVQGCYITQKTLQNYMYEINRHIIPRFGERDVRLIKPYHIDWFVSQLIAEGCAPSSIQYYVGRLSQILEFGYINEFLDRNPALKIRLPRISKNKPVILGDEAIRQIDALADPLMLLYLYTGLRRGEGLALTWDDICFESRKIHVTKSVSYLTNQGMIKPPKSEAGIRTVPIAEPNLHSLLYKLYCIRTSDYVFPNSRGGIMSLTSFRTYWKNIIKRLDLKITSKQLRHTYITLLYEAGVDVKTAQVWAGHSSIQITLDIYTHLRLSHHKAQTGKFTAFLTDRQKPA